jgi:hypothetical protein
MPGPTLTRSDLQQLADARLREARVLLAAGEHSGAYYLAGYAVECSLKACICRQYPGESFPSKARARGNIYIHDLDLLIHEAELTAAFIAETDADSDFANYWNVAALWSEQSRYAFFQEQEALGIYSAVSQAEHGVLQWLHRHW